MTKKDVKQSQNIIANKSAKSILLDTKEALASMFGSTNYAPAALVA